LKNWRGVDDARRRLDLRLVRRALRSADAALLLGEGCGFQLSWIDPQDGSALWERLRRNNAGPGGVVDGDYMGNEFVNR